MKEQGKTIIIITHKLEEVLVISDVIGDRLDVIASGPFAPDPSTYAAALAVLAQRDPERRVPNAVREYLEAGVRLIWVIDPRRARAVVYRSLSDVREVSADDVLDGEDVLPGFRCVLHDLLS